MDNIELIIDFYKDGKRQGPGSHDDTIRALKLTGIDFSENLNIADIGCGSGAQTLDLATFTKGHIVGVDLFPEFLEKLRNRAAEKGLSKRIETLL